MRPGFEVTLTATEKAKFNCFLPAIFPEPALVTFSEDTTAEIAVALMGKIHYQDNLKTKFPEIFQQNLTSNAALVLAIFQKYDTAGLQQLEGEFALVIFAAKQQRLLAMRDPLGNYPLYWIRQENTVRVSTNLKLLARQCQCPVNRDFLAAFLMFPFAFVELATEATAFQKIQRILPGTLLELTPNQTNCLWFWDWDTRIKPVTDITLPEAAAEFKHLLRQSIQQRLQGAKIASHLSGGMDSTSVALIAAELLGQEKLFALSLVYGMESLAGETAYIEMICDRSSNLDYQFIDGDGALDFQWFAGIPEHDEPYPGLFHLAMEKILVDRAAELGVRVIFSGGGAELVTQGNRYHLADLIRAGSWQTALREARSWAEAKNQSLWSILFEFGVEPSVPPRLRVGWGQWPKLGEYKIPPWILPDFAQKYHLADKARATLRQLYHYPMEQSFNRLGLQASAGNWASWYLAAPQGISISQPFLDTRLIAYCLSLPRQLRENPQLPKPLLQEAMQGILPEAIRMRRIKGNFNEVYWRGLSRNLPQLEAMVRQSSIDELEIFDKIKLIEVMGQHALGIGDVKSGSRIASSLATIAWFEQHK